jgi:hypothetical protein
MHKCLVCVLDELVRDIVYMGKSSRRPLTYTEVEIATLLSSWQALAVDPLNHCVPIYETLKMPDDDDKTVLAMPFLRSWYNLRLQTVGEAF